MDSNIKLSNLGMQANENLQARFLSCTPPFSLTSVLSLARSFNQCSSSWFLPQ